MKGGFLMKRDDILKIVRKELKNNNFSITKDNLKLVIKSYENAIVNALENKEDKVILSGFITFKRTKTAKRKFRNFTTKKIEISKGRDIIKILPGSNIKKAM